jgi:hypothetical protein
VTALGRDTLTADVHSVFVELLLEMGGPNATVPQEPSTTPSIKALLSPVGVPADPHHQSVFVQAVR